MGVSDIGGLLPLSLMFSKKTRSSKDLARVSLPVDPKTSKGYNFLNQEMCLFLSLRWPGSFEWTLGTLYLVLYPEVIIAMRRVVLPGRGLFRLFWCFILAVVERML